MVALTVVVFIVVSTFSTFVEMRNPLFVVFDFCSDFGLFFLWCLKCKRKMERNVLINYFSVSTIRVVVLIVIVIVLLS